MTLLGVMFVEAFHYLEASFLRGDAFLRHAVHQAVALPKLEDPCASVKEVPLANEYLDRFQSPAVGVELNLPVDNLLCVVSVVLNSLIDAANYRVVDLVAADFEDRAVAAYSEDQAALVAAESVVEIERVAGRYSSLAVQYDLSSQSGFRFDFVEVVVPSDHKVDIVDSHDFA